MCTVLGDIHASVPTPSRASALLHCGSKLACDNDMPMTNVPTDTPPSQASLLLHMDCGRTAMAMRVSASQPALFMRESSYTAERDLGAGRTQATGSGSSGMDAARAPSGNGCPFGASPRSVAGVRVSRRRRDPTRSRHPWLLGAPFQVTRQRRNKSGVSQNPISNTLNNGYAPRPNNRPVAARLAGGGDFKYVTAGKQCCYRGV
jgi:hypothetical protein